MIIISIIVIIIAILLFIRINREHLLYFRPDKKINNTEHAELNIDNHYALYINDKNNKCMLISHGNSSNIYNTNIIKRIKKIYDGDVYCYEYPGFGKCKGTTTVKGCVDEHLFWLDYLSKKYNHIDIWGYSIGGGIIAQTITSIPEHIEPKIHKIYFHNTFSNPEKVFKSYSIIGYYIYKMLLINDSNYTTFKILSHSFFKNKEIIILHSLEDEVIPFSEALDNFHICKNLGYNIKLIKLIGNHRKYILDKID